ncbi:hypothetical protein G3554_03785 [Micromonospora sp. PPF5-17]|uniref:hypothetical protein n=1 Tax=Micromonospora solifontis TaxID=2487138 RepID=UPI001319D7CD|nr:hypothetical protein [Micromonospora solifontis]NES35288.1 hypothetical protein [Micromonospora solifontis]
MIQVRDGMVWIQQDDADSTWVTAREVAAVRKRLCGSCFCELPASGVCGNCC